MDAGTTGGRGPGPSPWGLIALALSAVAMLALMPPIPMVERSVTGEAVVSAGAAVERRLEVTISAAAATGGDGAMGARLGARFEAASGLAEAPYGESRIEIVGPAATAPGDPPASGSDLPLDRCTDGCTLTYAVRITGGPGVLPGSVARYVVYAWISYEGGKPVPDPNGLRLDLEGAASGVVAPVWGILAGLLAMVLGTAAGPAVHRRLGPGRRGLPAAALLLLVIGAAAWGPVRGTIAVVAAGYLPELLADPLGLLYVVDAFALGVLGTLAWGLWRGRRRWAADGGWLLGVAAVATVGLGGLWLTWSSTTEQTFQPLAFAAQAALVGGLGGVVIGQAWRAVPLPGRDRCWAALAVLANGVLVAGLWFLVVQGLRTFPDPALHAMLLVLPAGLVLLGFRRWLRGRRTVLAAVDTLILLVGILETDLLSTSLPYTGYGGPSLDIAEVGVALAVVAALVGAMTATHLVVRSHPPVTRVDVDPGGPLPTT
jgi:hypothetical protein